MFFCNFNISDEVYFKHIRDITTDKDIAVSVVKRLTPQQFHVIGSEDKVPKLINEVRYFPALLLL